MVREALDSKNASEHCGYGARLAFKSAAPLRTETKNGEFTFSGNPQELSERRR